MDKMTREDALRHLGGSVDTIDQELRNFSDAAQLLSSDHPRLIDEHPLQWVGIFQGKIAASAQTLNSLMAQLEDEGISPANTIVRFIDKDERTLIL